MLYDNQDKVQSSNSSSKPDESAHQPTNPAVAPTQQPVWTQAMGNHPPVSLQAKLTINQPGDVYEQEADRVADQVVMRKHSGGTPAILDEEEEEEEQKRSTLMRKESSGTQAAQSAPPIVSQALSSGGQPLDAGTRATMEPNFGQDFSGVRVHTDE